METSSTSAKLKLPSSLTFPLNGYNYELCGVVEHQETPRHYICLVEDSTNKDAAWFEYDDNECERKKNNRRNKIPQIHAFVRSDQRKALQFTNLSFNSQKFLTASNESQLHHLKKLRSARAAEIVTLGQVRAWMKNLLTSSIFEQGDKAGDFKCLTNFFALLKTEHIQPELKALIESSLALGSLRTQKITLELKVEDRKSEAVNYDDTQDMLDIKVNNLSQNLFNVI